MGHYDLPSRIAVVEFATALPLQVNLVLLREMGERGGLPASFLHLPFDASTY